jgi:hypothetical protein
MMVTFINVGRRFTVRDLLFFSFLCRGFFFSNAANLIQHQSKSVIDGRSKTGVPPTFSAPIALVFFIFSAHIPIFFLIAHIFYVDFVYSSFAIEIIQNICF